MKAFFTPEVMAAVIAVVKSIVILLAVVITAGNYGQGIIWNRWRDSIVAQQIIRAIRRGE